MRNKKNMKHLSLLPRPRSRDSRHGAAIGAILFSLLALFATACSTGSEGQSNGLSATSIDQVLPDGLFDALERISEMPDGQEAPDGSETLPDSGDQGTDFTANVDDQPGEQYETLVPAQADTETELTEEELLKMRDEAFVDYSRCIRDEGFSDFPNIDSSQIVDQASFLAAMQEAGVSFTQPGLAQALQACAGVFSELISLAPQQDTNAQQVEREENAVAFAQCMRDQGVDGFPDPDFAQYPGSGFQGGGDNGANITPEIRAALQVCLPVMGGQPPNEAAAAPTSQEPATAESTQTADAGTPDSQPATQTATQTATQEPTQESTQGATASPGPTVSAGILRDTEELNTAEVVRRDLIDTEEFSGTLGYGDPEPFYTNTTGIVTGRLPEEGEVLGVGDVLFEVNGYPIVLLEGDRPMYRRFSRLMDDGPDVRQLERALVAMDIPGSDHLYVDDDFNVLTENVIAEWQNRLGVEESGEIEVGFVVFITKPFRISAVNVIEGQTISSQMAAFTITGQSQEIISNLDPNDAEIVNALDRVEVELPDGRIVPGAVAEVARVATREINPQTGAPGDPTIEVTIVLIDGEASARFDAAPVDWTITKQVTPDALVVPASALIATVDGGFSVEVVADGSTRLVPVEVGTYVDAFVEITGGNLQVDDRVRIP